MARGHGSIALDRAAVRLRPHAPAVIRLPVHHAAPHRLRRSIAGWLAASSLLVPVSGRAAEPTRDRVALLPTIVHAGERLPASWRAALHERVREGLARGRVEVVAAEAPDGCDAACRRARGSSAGARWVARAELTVRGRDFDVTVALFDGSDGAPISEASDACEVCAVAEVGDVLADQAAALAAKLAALTEAPPVVRFESTPAGATIAIDGRTIGTAPLARTVDPGRHRARARLDGHVPLELQFDAIAGTRDTVRLVLSPIARAPRRRLAVAGWTSSAAGLAIAGAGAPLLALHGRPYRTRCSGADVDADGDCRFRYDTRAGGAVLISLGAAALVAGITMLIVAARARRARR